MSEQVLTPEQSDALRSAIPYKFPYCSGSRDVPAESCFLFYEKDGDARRLDLLNATAEELAHLEQSCDPATFGLNQQDVLDESYRKAGKLDSSRFAVTFDLAGSGVLNLVQADLLEGRFGDRLIIPKLYKLNVYGEGSFFKEHKDTPRGQNMFGSLVVVLPTSHEGGAFILRQDDREWTFDSGREIAARAHEPFVSYIAFYGDVNHEVSPVLSGHRITLTYNLYFGDKEPIVPDTCADEEKLQATLSTLLADPLFLSKGGRLGFGLRYLYPVRSYSTATAYQGVTRLSSFLDRLKGSDALIARACTELSLRVSVKVVYQLNDYGEVMCDHLVDLPCEEIEDSFQFLEVFAEAEGSFIKYNSKGTFADAKDRESYIEDEGLSEELMTLKTVNWITEMTPFNAVPEKYVSYGNEASLDELYGNLCLVVEIGQADARSTLSDED